MSLWKREMRRRLLAAAALAAVAIATPSLAQEPPRQAYDLPAQMLSDALRAVSRVSGKEIIIASDAVKNLRAPKLVGAFTLDEAVHRLIDGTGLTADVRDDVVLIRGRSTPSSEAPDRPAGGTDIVVTGSRIKGAPPTSPVIVLTNDSIRLAGHNDLGEAIRSLPQNFSGGQNPGITFTAPGTNQNLTSGSSLNLRGLGADASLTLLNGHRLAYDSAIQAIDISSIPLAAVDRVEIVADGASALYGSDAVGGVANIILKRDFVGLEARTRVGAATEGGLVQQQYSVTAGGHWSSGGVLATLDYQNATQIAARDRKATSAVPGDTTLYPSIQALGIVGTGHQRLGADITFDMDGYYSRRKSSIFSSYGTDGYTQDGSATYSEVGAYGLSPRFSLDVSNGWHAEVRGTYGFERDDLRLDYYSGGTLFLVGPTRYDNRLKSVEVAADGGLVALPGGLARLAVGGGYRSVGLYGLQQLSVLGGPFSTSLEFDKGQNAYFGFGELYVPLVSPQQQIAGISRLSLTAAGRFEHYQTFGSVFTPKLGIIFSPIAAMDIKGSWGQSFKAPTLRETAIPASAVLSRASQYASGYPAAAAVLYSDGGNPDLRAEHATTWTATLDLHPTFFGGAKVEISYFNIGYRDRVLSPIGALSGSLTNPLYRDLVTLNPTTAQIDAIIARSSEGLTNNTSFPFAYSNVIAIVDNRYRNVAQFTAKGVDFSASVPIDLANAGKLLAATSISYLESAQQTSPGDASLMRAGTIANPPHWRMHASATWGLGSLTIAPAIDYIGDVTDNRTALLRSVGSMTTFDLTARYRVEREGPFNGVELSLSALNLFNAMPAPIVVSAFYFPAYDSTNYSAIGRTVSVTVAKKW